mmetsp:Transcript_104065/g.320995  ORF Transcript_104065/g.320995 Transcript_104065/m.320995 type:complete len:354 (-) Transcript_104065:847-1908(-)
MAPCLPVRVRGCHASRRPRQWERRCNRPAVLGLDGRRDQWGALPSGDPPPLRPDAGRSRGREQRAQAARLEPQLRRRHHEQHGPLASQRHGLPRLWERAALHGSVKALDRRQPGVAPRHGPRGLRFPHGLRRVCGLPPDLLAASLQRRPHVREVPPVGAGLPDRDAEQPAEAQEEEGGAQPLLDPLRALQPPRLGRGLHAPACVRRGGPQLQLRRLAAGAAAHDTLPHAGRLPPDPPQPRHLHAARLRDEEKRGGHVEGPHGDRVPERPGGRDDGLRGLGRGLGEQGPRELRELPGALPLLRPRRRVHDPGQAGVEAVGSRAEGRRLQRQVQDLSVPRRHPGPPDPGPLLRGH